MEPHPVEDKVQRTSEEKQTGEEPGAHDDQNAAPEGDCDQREQEGVMAGAEDLSDQGRGGIHDEEQEREVTGGVANEKEGEDEASPEVDLGEERGDEKEAAEDAANAGDDVLSLLFGPGHAETEAELEAAAHAPASHGR